MKKQLLVGAALLAAVSGTATAADLSRPAPAPAPVYTKAPPIPQFTWTGFYIGGNIGGAWNSSSWTDTLDPGVTFGNNNNNGVFIGGGQAGFNYQISSLVLGVEGT